jgi:hypothetical protein
LAPGAQNFSFLAKFSFLGKLFIIMGWKKFGKINIPQ